MVVDVLQGLLQSGGYPTRPSHPRSQSMQVRCKAESCLDIIDLCDFANKNTQIVHIFE